MDLLTANHGLGGGRPYMVLTFLEELSANDGFCEKDSHCHVPNGEAAKFK